MVGCVRAKYRSSLFGRHDSSLQPGGGDAWWEGLAVCVRFLGIVGADVVYFGVAAWSVDM